VLFSLQNCKGCVAIVCNLTSVSYAIASQNGGLNFQEDFVCLALCFRSLEDTPLEKKLLQ